MSFSIGIVGLPNVGKSTLFKALTKKQVDISNYPFCTIDKNVGVVAVPDERLDKLAAALKPEKILPTTIEFFDIAGLVKNAHQGEGLGNQFLGYIREVDAITQVIRKFSDANVSHVAGKIDPESDKETVNLELIFADLDTIKKRREKLTKLTHGQNKEAEKALAVLDRIKKELEAGKPASSVELTEEEEEYIKDLNLLTRKPMLYVLNVDEDKIFQESDYISISAKIEAELTELEPAEAKEYIKELGLKESGLDKLISASYQLLDLITFFTTQSNILQAWTVPKNTKAPEAAGRIHGDFEKNFIKAEVINWEKLVEIGSEQQAHEQGLLRTEGKDYVVQDGDVIRFKTSA